MKNFIVIAPLSSISKRLRLNKICDVFHNHLNVDITHVGWERVDNERFEGELDYRINKKIILKGGGWGNKIANFLYFLWMVKVFFYGFKLKKNDIVWALGFETALPLMFSKKIIGYKLYFDDADRISMVLNFLGFFKKIIIFLEKIVSRNSTLHIVPGLSRYDFESNKLSVLNNIPSRKEFLKAKKYYQKNSWPKARIVININGRMFVERGMDVVLELSRRLKDKDIHFIMAGRLDCKEAVEIIKEDNVTYLGDVSNSVALASYFASDFVLTYYNPKFKINQYAQSNKWGDAIKCEIGIIVNSEVITARDYIESNMAISVPYHDVLGLEEEIIKVYENPMLLDSYKKCSKGRLLEDSIFFEDNLLSIIQ